MAAPKYFRDFFRSASISGSASATLISERWVGIPGVISWVGLGVQDVTLWATATFSVRINGVPVTDYGTIQDEIGAMKAPSMARIAVPPDALIEVTAANGGASATLFAARLVVEA